MQRMYINIDCNSVVDPFLHHVTENDNITKDMLYPFVDQYIGTCVTDLIFNNYCQSSITKSEVCEDFETKYNKEYENGIKVDYKSLDFLRTKLK